MSFKNIENSIIITSNGGRHNYFVNKILDKINCQEVFVDNKENEYYFEELNLLYTSNKFNYIPINKVDYENYVYDYISENFIDYIFVFGCGLIPKKIVDTDVKIINIHTGLTQYYRGVDSSLWCCYKNDFDKIGFTIHQVDNGIDTGPVISQQLFDFSVCEKDETIDTLFIKLCIQSIDYFTNNIHRFITSPTFKYPNGKLYTSQKLISPHIKRKEQVRRKSQENLTNFLNNGKR